jgi:cytochrome c oxidase subunit 4
MAEPVEQEHREGAHPPTATYWAVFAVLVVITIVEVGVFYVPAFHDFLAPILLTLSAGKFALVVMFYMHLKFDHPLFRTVFTLPLLIAVAVIVSLLFLYGVVGV